MFCYQALCADYMNIIYHIVLSKTWKNWVVLMKILNIVICKNWNALLKKNIPSPFARPSHILKTPHNVNCDVNIVYKKVVHTMAMDRILPPTEGFWFS